MAVQRDVQLVVKARDEGTRVVEKYADSILKLIRNQDSAGDSAGNFSKDLIGLMAALADVEKANGLVVSAADRADAAFKRQSSNLAETRAQLQSTKAQIEGAARAIAAAQTKLVDTALAGGNMDAVRAEILAAEAALKTLTSTEARLTQSIRTQESALGQQRSSLQEISSLANTTEAALKSLGSETEREALKGKAAIEAETRALSCRTTSQTVEAHDKMIATKWGGICLA